MYYGSNHLELVQSPSVAAVETYTATSSSAPSPQLALCASSGWCAGELKYLPHVIDGGRHVDRNPVVRLQLQEACQRRRLPLPTYREAQGSYQEFGCECLLTTYVWAPPANRVPPPGFIPVKIHLLPVSLAKMKSRDNFFTISRIAVFYHARNRVTVIPRSESK